MGHVQRIGGLSAHPLGECLVVWQRRRVIPTQREPLGLGIGGDVQQTHSDSVQARR